ncbi:hypothetical protein GCM10011363_30650 [Marivita lacus]|uniref:Transposase n=1 Tax=Marivita lacus TaxID=1323742 RepID=A0ABQ1KZD4_9RHOB|nr:hypothetical protein GCM10011363_30650 [Marivita lacus]
MISPVRSNLVQSTSQIRHLIKRKGCLSRDGMLNMMFKLGQCGEKSWRKLRGFAHLADVIQGVDFVNGIKP